MKCSLKATGNSMSILLYWAVTPSGLVGRYQHFREIYSIFRPEDGNSMFL
jgi:hypothetical protein